MSYFSRLFGASQKHIHMDYAATTPIDKGVLAEMTQIIRTFPSNPGSLHSGSTVAAEAISNYRAEMAQLLHTEAHDIVFTRGGTEACNIAIRHALSLWKRSHPDSIPHVIISPIEHSAIHELCAYLSGQGLIELTIAPISSMGLVDPQAVSGLLKSNTAVVAIQLVNSEIGIIQPIKKITHIVRRFKTGQALKLFPLVVCDAIQGGDLVDIRPQSLGVDYLALSASKFYGPKSGGILCIPRGQHVAAGVLLGGTQEYSLRPGTEDIMLIAGAVAAYRKVRTSLENRISEMQALRDYCIGLIQLRYPHVVINSTSDGAPHIVHISLPHMDSDYAVLFFDKHGVEVASQSACSAHVGGISRVIQTVWSARGVSNPESYAHIRFSFGRTTTRSDIDRMLSVLGNLLQQRYVRS